MIIFDIKFALLFMNVYKVSLFQFSGKNWTEQWVIEVVIYKVRKYSREMPFLRQTSSEQADAQSRPQVRREMLSVHWEAWTWLCIVTLECKSLVKRFPPKTANLNSTSTTKTRRNKYARRLRYTERTLLNRNIQKNWSTKYQSINTQPMKTKQSNTLTD